MEAITESENKTEILVIKESMKGMKESLSIKIDHVEKNVKLMIALGTFNFLANIVAVISILNMVGK